MKTTEINPNAISTAAGVIPENVPIIMVNLLRYKEHANYGNRTDIAPCSGREAYFQHYVSAFNKIAAEIEGTDGIRPFYVSTVLAQLAAPTDESGMMLYLSNIQASLSSGVWWKIQDTISKRHIIEQLHSTTGD